MATDLDAQEVQLNYDGGSLTMTRGNAKDLFGEDSNIFGADGQPMTVSVIGHSRTRIIGQPAKQIAPHVREYIQWPTGSASIAAGGEPIYMEWTGSEGKWMGRVSGPLWKLGSFLQQFSPKTVTFRAKGGKPYGPFQRIVGP